MTRGLNAVFALPPDPSRCASFLTPALERLDAAQPGPQLLIATVDAESAMALAAAAAAIGAARGITVLAATSAARAARLLRDRTPHVIAAPTDTLVGLLQRSALKLDTVRHVVLAWLDDALDLNAAPLEALLAELPKEGARTIVVRRLTPEVEQLIERYARRARRVLPEADDTSAGMAVQFVSGPDASRPAALRRVLDELDPARAFVLVRDPQSDLNAGTTLRTMGYDGDAPVSVGAAMPADADLLVLYDLPATRAELRAALAGHAARQIVALVQPRQLPALRDFASGPVTPFMLPEPAARARAREAQLLDALRAELSANVTNREVLALEPLLAEYDGVEVAAAALRLLEAERRRAAAARPAAAPKMARLFINAGQTDNIRAGDLVGAIANVTGLTGNDIGRIELRDRHALVEVPADAAATVVEKLTGVTIRGRQIVARLDQERPDRGDRGGHAGRGAPSRGPRKWEDRKR